MGKHVNSARIAEKWATAAVWVRLLPLAAIWLLFFTLPKHGTSADAFNIQLIIFIVIPIYILDGIIAIRTFSIIGMPLVRQSYFLFSYFAILSGGFSLTYWLYGYRPYFHMSLTRLDAFYFMLGTFSTAGTGDIVANSELTRAFQSLQIVLDLAFVTFAVATVVARFVMVSSRSNSSPSS